MFNPIFGFIGLLMNSMKRKNDALETVNAALRKNPKAKIILTNFLYKPFIILKGSEYTKVSFMEHHFYERRNPFMIKSFM